jgi:hypothetical protein
VSIHFHLRPISDRAIDAARQSSELVDAFLWDCLPDRAQREPAADDQTPAAIIERSRVQDAKRYDARMIAALREADLSREDDLGPIYDLGRSWDGLGQALRELVSESTNLIMGGGEQIGEDVGYGPARFLLAEDVARARLECGSLDSKAVDAAIRRVLATPKPNPFGAPLPVYGTARDGDKTEAADWLNESFKDLMRALDDAARRGFGLAVWAA